MKVDDLIDILTSLKVKKMIDGDATIRFCNDRHIWDINAFYAAIDRNEVALTSRKDNDKL